MLKRICVLATLVHVSSSILTRGQSKSLKKILVSKPTTATIGICTSNSTSINTMAQASNDEKESDNNKNDNKKVKENKIEYDGYVYGNKNFPKVKPQKGQESVWDYPRPPRVEKTNAKIKIEFNNKIIAQTENAYRVLETSHPPVYYIPMS